MIESDKEEGDVSISLSRRLGRAMSLCVIIALIRDGEDQLSEVGSAMPLFPKDLSALIAQIWLSLTRLTHPCCCCDFLLNNCLCVRWLHLWWIIIIPASCEVVFAALHLKPFSSSSISSSTTYRPVTIRKIVRVGYLCVFLVGFACTGDNKVGDALGGILGGVCECASCTGEEKNRERKECDDVHVLCG